MPLGLCSRLYQARRRDPEMPVSRAVVVGLILDIRKGLVCRCFRKARGYVSARVVQVGEAGLQLGYVWGCGRSPGPRVTGLLAT